MKPTYLIDFPVATHPDSIKILRNLAATEECEIGAHLHPWCNPPYREDRNLRNTFVHHLPIALQKEKLQELTQAIQGNIGVQPVSYRAGRYGFDETTIPVLEELRYKVDTSVVPYRYKPDPVEPAFKDAPLNPYYLDYQNVCRQGESSILEIPVTVDYPGKVPTFLKIAYPRLPDIGIRRFLRIAFGIEPIWLRPSYASLPQMQRLCDSLIQRGIVVLNMMFHSSELMPGGSPYNKSESDVHFFLQKIEKLVRYLQQRYSLQFISLHQLPELFPAKSAISASSL